MTILSQATTIKNETTASANTANRVGTCLVDIANAINNSASFTASGQTTITDSASYPVLTDSYDGAIITGSGLSVTEGSGFYYFAGLNALNAYKVSFSGSATQSSASVIQAVYRLYLADMSDVLNSSYCDITIPAIGTGGASFSCTTVFTGQTGCVLGFAVASNVASIDLYHDITMTIENLGAAVV
jgi:hypothetical protein